MEKFNNKNKFIILMRHGQRIDNSNLYKLRKFPQDDPELTQAGREQACLMGTFILNYLKEMNIEINYKNIKFVTSPFSRCLQTTLSLIKGLNLNKQEINIDNLLSEVIYQNVVGDIPIKYLTIYSKPKMDNKFKSYFEELEKENISLNEKSTEKLPSFFEQPKQVYSRVKECFNKNIMDIECNNDIQVIIIISHLEIIKQMLNVVMENKSFSHNKFSLILKNSIENLDINYVDSFCLKISSTNNLIEIDTKLTIWK